MTRVHNPPALCRGCRFYDRYRGDCQNMLWHLRKERPDKDLHCPSHEGGPARHCPGDMSYKCTPGVRCDD